MDYKDLAFEMLAEADHSPSGYWRAHCRICLHETGKADRRKSWSINIRNGRYICFKCETKGRIKIPEHIERKAPTDDRAPVEAFERPESFELLHEDGGETLRAARDYMTTRGIDRKVWKGASVGACWGGYYADRIVVPVLSIDRRTWLGYVARDWTNKQELRYAYPLGMQRGKMLFNHEALHKKTKEPALLVEGCFDALSWWPHAVAFLGKPGRWHREVLRETKRPLITLLDGDAHEVSWALMMELRLHGVKAGFIKLPPTSDPNSVDHAWLQQKINTVNYEEI